MRLLPALLLALLLAGCGGVAPSAPVDEGANPDAVLRTWSDAMGSGDWARVRALSCEEADSEFDASGDESATALLDAASVRFELLALAPATVDGDAASIVMTARYRLVLDTARLQASLGDALLAAGAPAEEIDTLAAQAVEFISAGARAALTEQQIEAEIPLRREDGAWRVCAPGFSPLTLAFPTAD